MRTFFALIVSIATIATSFGQPYGAPPTAEEFFNSPEWRKRFLGSYGALSEAEPQIETDEEREVLGEVLDLMKNKGTEAASDRLEEAISEKSSAPLLVILANLQFQNGDREAAAETYRQALSKYKDFLRAHKNLGLLLVQEKQYEEALTHLTRAVELGSRDGRNYGLIAFCNVQLGNPFAALEAYGSAISMQPDQMDWKLGLAQVLSNIERYDELLVLINAILDEQPSNQNMWMLKGNALLGQNQPIKAAVALEMATLVGDPRPELLKLLGDIYMNQKMYGEAEETYRALIEKGEFPTNVREGLRAADLLLQTRNAEKALSLSKVIEQKYGDQLTKDDELELKTVQAKANRALGKEEEAAETLEVIVKNDPTRGDALLELADYYWKKADAITISSDADAEKKEELQRKKSDLQTQARMKLSNAMNLDNYRREALLKSAQFYVAKRQYKKAASELREALRIKDEERVRRFLDQVETAAQRG